MSDLDAARTALRRRAIAEDWPATMLAVVEDLADTARDDGTHALRTIDEQAARLGIAVATVERHRRKLRECGAITTRRKGGRGRGATVLDLQGPLDHPSPVGANVRADHVDSPAITPQSPLTVEREREGRPLSSSPNSSSQLPTDQGAAMHTDPDSPQPDDTQQVAAAYSVTPAVATRMLAILEADDRVTNPRGRLLTDTTWDSNQRVKAQAAQDVQGSRPRITARQCHLRDPHHRHEWSTVHNQPHLCLG